MIGALSLLAVSGCVALSGLDRLSIGNDDELSPDGAVGHADGGTLSDAQRPRDDSGFDFPGFDGNFPFPFDGNFPFDSSLPDANQPDTGGPESGPAGAGVVQCSGSLQCTDGKACCYSAFYPFPGCISNGSCATGGSGLACDDDTDCSGGNICCITPELATYSSSSSCKATCGNGSYHACATDDECGQGTTCKHVSLAPGPIKACQ